MTFSAYMFIGQCVWFLSFAHILRGEGMAASVYKLWEQQGDRDLQYELSFWITGQNDVTVYQLLMEAYTLF